MADYETSTQHKYWTFTKHELASIRKLDESYARVRLYLGEQLDALGRALGCRQRTATTAQLFLSRAFLKIRLQDMNLYLVVATCVYIAAKAEEQPANIRLVAREACKLWPAQMPPEPQLLAECEFYLLEELRACLVVHHAHHPLMKLSKEFELLPEEFQAAWAAINDAYLSDIPLLFAPKVVAFASMFMVLILKPELDGGRTPLAVKARLDALSVTIGRRSTLDLTQLAYCIQEFLSLYSLIESLDRTKVAAEVDAIIRGRR